MHSFEKQNILWTIVLDTWYYCFGFVFPISGWKSFLTLFSPSIVKKVVTWGILMYIMKQYFGCYLRHRTSLI